ARHGIVLIVDIRRLGLEPRQPIRATGSVRRAAVRLNDVAGRLTRGGAQDPVSFAIPLPTARPCRLSQVGGVRDRSPGAAGQRGQMRIAGRSNATYGTRAKVPSAP